jgi:hypothetical protein
MLEIALAWAWVFLALIAGAGTILAETGGLGGGLFFALHAVVLILLIFWRRKSIHTDFLVLVSSCQKTRQFINGRSSENFLFVLAMLSLTTLASLAVWAAPVVYDAHAYHLPRIAQWLQDGRINILEVQDERLNFVTGLPDLVMAWFLTATNEGFKFVNIPQAFGGIMAFGATVGLARQTGIGRSASLMAGMLLFGMANVAVQFTATQTDLFTAGVFSTAVYLWICALHRGEASILGGLGAGFALAAKGTLFYLAPGALIWVAWLAWRNPMPWQRWRRTIVAAIIGILFFAGPGLLRNKLAYGNMLGPPMWVEKLHRKADSLIELAQKILWNSQATLAQNFEPNSQPHGLHNASFTIASALAESLPDYDKFSLTGLNRRTTLQRIFARREPDSDVTSFGVVSLFLFSAGCLIAVIKRRQRGRGLVLAWSGGVIVFFVFFEIMQQWHPYAFRYFVLVAPWVAVVAAWALEQLPRWWRLAGWTLVLVSAFDVAWSITTRTSQAGWHALMKPEHSQGYFVEENWREWSQRLDRPDTPLVVALAEERPLSSFYRQHINRPVQLKFQPVPGRGTAEQFIGTSPGWVIVPAASFIGKEGEVAASVWLYNGDETNPFSVAAYRRLGSGEQARPVVYRHKRARNGKEIVDDLSIKTWKAQTVHFVVKNYSNQNRHCRIMTPLETKEQMIYGETITAISFALPTDRISSVKFIFSGAQSSSSLLLDPILELDQGK